MREFSENISIPAERGDAWESEREQRETGSQN